MAGTDAVAGHAGGWLSETLHRWRKTRAARAELRAMPQAEVQRMMHDIGLAPEDVERIVADHPGPEKLMPQRLEAFGIDPQYIKKSEPELYRDLERTCAKCGSWKTCERDLDRSNAAAGQHSYCLNSGTIDTLIVKIE